MPESRPNARLSDAEAIAMERGEDVGEMVRGGAEDQSHQEEQEDGGEREARRVDVEEEALPTADERRNSSWRRRRMWASSRRTQGWCNIVLLGLVLGFGCIFVYAWVEAFREVTKKAFLSRTPFLKIVQSR